MKGSARKIMIIMSHGRHEIRYYKSTQVGSNWLVYGNDCKVLRAWRERPWYLGAMHIKYHETRGVYEDFELGAKIKGETIDAYLWRSVWERVEKLKDLPFFKKTS